MNLQLTPHGRLVLIDDAGAPQLDSGLLDRLRAALERGPGHGILLLGADEVAATLPPVYSYWREFGARYVTAVCTQQEGRRRECAVPPPAVEELERIALAAPPMTGAEYLTAAVLEACGGNWTRPLELNWPNRNAVCRSF